MKHVKGMNAWETLLQIPNRIISLIFNMVSRFGVMLAATFFLVYNDLINNWYACLTWIVFSLVFLYKDQAPEMIDKIIKLKELK